MNRTLLTQTAYSVDKSNLIFVFSQVIKSSIKNFFSEKKLFDTEQTKTSLGCRRMELNDLRYYKVSNFLEEHKASQLAGSLCPYITFNVIFFL